MRPPAKPTISSASVLFRPLLFVSLRPVLHCQTPIFPLLCLSISPPYILASALRRNRTRPLCSSCPPQPSTTHSITPPFFPLARATVPLNPTPYKINVHTLCLLPPHNQHLASQSPPNHTQRLPSQRPPIHTRRPSKHPLAIMTSIKAQSFSGSPSGLFSCKTPVSAGGSSKMKHPHLIKSFLLF